jgi:soluble lytic murein transglycosylase
MAFITANPTWPGLVGLEINAERRMADASDASVLEWFRVREPESRDGRLRLIKAAEHANDTKRASAVARQSWLEDDFGPDEEKEFLARFGRYLTPDVHTARLDRLLWENKDVSARRMYRHVDKGWTALAEARLGLHAETKNAVGLLAKVPTALRRDPGLLYERVRWRRLKGREDEARALLLSVKNPTTQQALWWSERRRLARSALEKGPTRDAYRIAAGHGLNSGAAFADAEWLAGWIALRFRNDAKTALRHFTKMHDGVSAPISLARAAYWAGRAAEATGDKTTAAKWYFEGARWPSTYYGQLAASRASGRTTPLFAAAAQVAAAQIDRLPGLELVTAARLLALLGEDELVPPFVMQLAELARGPADHAMVGALAREIGRPDLGVRAAKHAASQGYLSIDELYPVADLPFQRAKVSIERALVLAITRQESQFDPKARSSAGALGLMQLLPSTARHVAKSFGIKKVNESDLTRNLALNVQLGSAYLGDMIRRFDNSYVLGVAAYNAGPTNVAKWLKANGDPRRSATVDFVDWIELIEFEETRNYVQRVLEGVQVYRWRLGETVNVASLERDLVRGVEPGVLKARCAAKSRQVERAATLKAVC